MTRTTILGALACAALGVSSVDCALTQKATPADARYFSPELPSGQAPTPAVFTPKPQADGKSYELRLGRVTSGAHLRERIVFRDSKYELGFYEDLRWTERPDAYLRRALSQVLFEELGLRSVVSGNAPVLDVELVHFEEVRKPQHVATISLAFSLRDDRVVRRAQTITLERPIPATEKAEAPAAMAATLGEAMRTAVSQLGERVMGELAPPPAVATTPAP